MQSDYINELGLTEFQTDGVFPSVLGGELQKTGSGDTFFVTSPIDGSTIGQFKNATKEQLNTAVVQAEQVFREWRKVPAPIRGELVRRIGNVARKYKTELAQVITLESGKIIPEALGEVQEWIDICDFAVGLSRQLHGLTIASERPGHRMMEQWHPLGPVAVITAFNFPMAVWAWNSMLGLVCGDTIVFKPSEKTPLCALACQAIVIRALDELPDLPKGVCSVVVGDREIGQAMAEDKRFPLVSATGSTAMGKSVGQTVGARLGRSLLELGGNNAMIVSKTVDLELALRAIVFSAVGTTGQRCTSLRRVIAHESVVGQLMERLLKSYQSLPIGDPSAAGTLVGPLIDKDSFNRMQTTLKAAEDQGGEILYGGERIHENVPDGGFYLRPAIVRIRHDAEIVQEETFAPILYVMTYTDIDDAIEIQNRVPQGLSSAIFTESLREAELFLSPTGSDCGIANVNIGTSGAEIGGAFGGEKDTGGGRESGSDAWKNYMRRATNTINYGGDLPLAQGIVFE